MNEFKKLIVPLYTSDKGVQTSIETHKTKHNEFSFHIGKPIQACRVKKYSSKQFLKQIEPEIPKFSDSLATKKKYSYLSTVKFS